MTIGFQNRQFRKISILIFCIISTFIAGLLLGISDLFRPVHCDSNSKCVEFPDKSEFNSDSSILKYSRFYLHHREFIDTFRVNKIPDSRLTNRRWYLDIFSSSAERSPDYLYNNRLTSIFMKLSPDGKIQISDNNETIDGSFITSIDNKLIVWGTEKGGFGNSHSGDTIYSHYQNFWQTIAYQLNGSKYLVSDDSLFIQFQTGVILFVDSKNLSTDYYAHKCPSHNLSDKEMDWLFNIPQNTK